MIVEIAPEVRVRVARGTVSEVMAKGEPAKASTNDDFKGKSKDKSKGKSKDDSSGKPRRRTRIESERWLHWIPFEGRADNYSRH